MNFFYLKKPFFILLICLFLGITGFQWLNKKTGMDSLFLFSEIQTASVNFQNEISDFMKKYLFLLDRYEKNKELERQNKELKVRHQLFEETLKENERLKKLIQFTVNQPLNLLPAQITGTDFLSKNELLTINKGSFDGVKKFMGVLHPTGVVGYIFRISPHSAQVISLLNPLASLPARHKTQRINGLISAGPKGLLLFDYLDQDFSEDKNNGDLKLGDSIVTIKSDQFPAGFLAGHILSIDYPPKGLAPKVYVRPAVPFHSLEEVLVVLTSQNPQPPNPVSNSSLNKDKSNEPEN